MGLFEVATHLPTITRLDFVGRNKLAQFRQCIAVHLLERVWFTFGVFLLVSPGHQSATTAICPCDTH